MILKFMETSEKIRVLRWNLNPRPSVMSWVQIPSQDSDFFRGLHTFQYHAIEEVILNKAFRNESYYVLANHVLI